MTIKDLMTKDVATVGTEDTAATAARKMWDCDCGALPVVDGGNKVIGMITDRDICMAAMHRDAAPSAFRAADAMSKRIFTITETDSLSTAEQLMRDNQVRRLPVVDGNGQARGILSLADVVRATELGAGPSKPISSSDVTSTMARIVARPDQISGQRASH
jgi:CBS domain-containing protein